MSFIRTKTESHTERKQERTSTTKEIENLQNAENGID
jgi:hypothetical protein